MLYVIETDGRGRVTDTIPCANGIDQAICEIAVRLAGSEEDPGVAYDVTVARWADAVCTSERNGETAEASFQCDRGERTPHYGLAVIA